MSALIWFAVGVLVGLCICAVYTHHHAPVTEPKAEEWMEDDA